MSRRRPGPGIVAAAALAVLASCGGEEGPVYRGRDVERWEILVFDSATRGGAVAELREGGDEAVGVLAALASSRHPSVRGTALELIIDLGPEAAGAVDALVPLLDEQDAGARGLAALALGRIGPQAGVALPRLEALFDDPDERVRVSAAVATWRVAREGREALRVMLRGQRGAPPVRAMVAEGLAEFGKDAVEPLIEALEDENQAVRIHAAQALGQIGPAAIAARVPLQRLRDGSDDPFVKAAALGALRNIPNE